MHEKPSQFSDVGKAVDDMFNDLMSKDKLPHVIKLLSEGKVFVDRIASAYIEQGLVTGRWNTDMAHALVEPTIFLFAWIASQTGMPVVFREAAHFDSGGMDVLGKVEESQVEEAVQSLLAPDEETV
jgi:hypothetical protein